MASEKEGWQQDEAATEGGTVTRAFLTGSRVYGEPRPDSDIDLVVLLDAVTAAKLVALSDDSNGSAHESPDVVVAKYGNFNLIGFVDQKRFDAWQQGTNDLAKIAPVTRATAVAHIKAQVVKAGLRP